MDDDPQTLRYVRDALSKAGYTPIVTADLVEVPRLMDEEEPRLVLLDLMLPGSDGITLMRDILDIADVPVIFLSVYGQDEVIARAFDMGRGTTSSSPSRPRSWRPGSGRPCAGGCRPMWPNRPNPMCWQT